MKIYIYTYIEGWKIVDENYFLAQTIEKFYPKKYEKLIKIETVIYLHKLYQYVEMEINYFSILRDVCSIKNFISRMPKPDKNVVLSEKCVWET